MRSEIAKVAQTVLFIVIVSAWSASGQQIIYVNENAPPGSFHNGASWSNAFTDLQSALALANPTSSHPVSVYVARGTYKPTPGTNQSASFVLKSYLSIFGGFAGNESNPNQRPGFGPVTVLSGDIGVPSSHPLDQNNIQYASVPFDPADPGAQDNSYNVLWASNVTSVLLDSLYVTAGYSDVSTNAVNPTELLSMAITPGPTNSNESFSGNTILPLDSRVAGGGLFLVNPSTPAPPDDVSLTLRNCFFVANGARGYGGGVAVKYATVEIDGTTFANNFAGQEGGGYWSMNCVAEINYCTFQDNTSYGDGGGAVLQTMPTDYTVDPFSGDDEATRQTTENIVGSSLDGAKFATKLYALPSVDGGFVTKLRTLLPGSPFEAIPAGADAAEQAAAVGSRLTRSLDWVTIAVTAVDFVSDIVSAAGGGNSAFVKDWSWFSENFNNYCTPQGWIYYLFEGIGLIRSPSPTQKAVEVLQQEASVYNSSGYSSMLGCRFVGNTAADEGGGCYCLYENIQIENCIFERNAAQDAGALANLVWSEPIILGCAFVQNFATAGQSAVVNAFHERASYLNCTFSDNFSATTGYAMGNEAGSDVTICNSIFWGNTNLFGTNFASGADIFTSVSTNLDVTTLSNYNNGLSDGTFVDWIATCDVSWSCVESLRQLPLGFDRYDVVFPEGFSPSHNELESYLDQWNADLFQNDLDGLLDALGYINTGEGFRANILDRRKGNISTDPFLINGYIPSRYSPVIDTGNGTRLNNGVINSLTGLDAQWAPRFFGANIDIGAVEYQGGPDPDLLPGFPVPVNYQPRVIYVSPGGKGARTGNDWADATGDLRGAMTNFDFQVWVAAGTYYPTANSDRTLSFSLGLSSRVYGGFAGNETNLSQRNWTNNPTILSGDIGVRGNDSDNSFHVVANTNNKSGSVLDGFTITKGRGDNGAGIYNQNSFPVITNCVFLDNQATFLGGAIYNANNEGSPINQCSFINNSSGVSGGAIFMNVETFIENCVFIRNVSASGGAISFSNANYGYVFNSLFVSNGVVGGAGISGGAIEAENTAFSIFNSTFACNYDSVAGSATPAGAAGLDYQSTIPGQRLFVENSIFWNNRVTNALGPVGTDEEQQITTNSSSPYLIINTLIQGLEHFAGAVTSGNIDVDPLFANPTAGDFSLLPYSPAIDAGATSGQSLLVQTDLAGNPRKMNQSIDLGAYEFQAAPIKVSVQISVTRNCDDSGAVYSLQLLPISGPALPLNGSQWQVNKNDGSGFNSISSDGVYSGTMSSNLTITHPSLNMNGYRYRVLVSSSNLQFSSYSGTIYVSPSRLYVKTAASGANTGLTWADAFTDLQSALAAAQPCSQIWVAAGTYFPSSSGDTNVSFRMRSDVGIYGGFAGAETNLNQRNWIANPTILSGNLGVGGKSMRVVLNDGSQVGLQCGPTAILDGFTIRDAVGTGMVNYYASPTVRNCVFTNNSGPEGGAMRNFFSSSPLVENCAFQNNSGSSGGAVDCSQNANATFVNCLFADNAGSFEGGALAISLSDVHLLNCTVADNFAAVSGGGLYSQSATVEFLNSILWGNSDQEHNPSAIGPQIFLDTGAALNSTNSCIQGLATQANGNIAFDPLFAAESAGNFRLTSNSPAIDHGTSALIVGFNSDLDGNNRIVNASVDIGAYEFPTLVGSPVELFRVPQAATTCNANGVATFSVTGTNGSASKFSWLVNKNDGNGFVSVIPNASATVTVSNGTSTLILSNVSLTMNGYSYSASISATSFRTPPVPLTVQLPGTIFVNRNVIGGTGDGTSWANAFSDLQKAINSVPACSEIWVAQGSYSPGIDAYGSPSFHLVSGVGIYGGFAGSETLRSQRNWTNHPVVITGGNGNSALFDNLSQSAVIDSTAVLDGFVFVPNNGFSMNNFGANPVIQNCVFTSNYQFAIFNRNSSPSIAACIFTNNSGISVYNQLSSPSISQSIFAANQTLVAGGAIYNWQSSTVVSDCLFTNNSASTGGAIFNDNLSMGRIDRCRFLGNAATGPGGAIYNAPSAAPSILNSIFDRNTSQIRGGAIADYGGGMTLSFCTLARNRSSYSGAGLYFQGTAASVDSCIIWENTALQNPDGNSVEKVQLDNSGASLSISYSIVQGLSALPGIGNLPYDPLFADMAGGNFRLSPWSPAINSGDTAAAANEPSDVTGQPRAFGGIPDCGAYEFQSSPAGVLSILGLPQSLTTCVSASAQFEIVTKIGDTNFFQWQVSTGGSFSNVPNTPPFSFLVGGNTNALLMSVSLPMSGSVFRFVNTASGYVSPSFTLTVTPPSIIYVNASAPGPGNGSSWATALTNLQGALSLGSACSEIWVARGTYVPSVALSGAPWFAMQPGVRAYGGFAGTETNVSQRNWNANPTVLKALANNAVIQNIGGAQTIDDSSLLDGFTIDGQNYAGNAILNINTSPTFQNCLFINGSPAMWNANAANPLILSCVFSNNPGQGMVNEQSAPVASNCVFVANNGNNLEGGAIVNIGASPSFFACQFLSNSAIEGAAIALDQNSASVIKGSIFAGNNSSAVGAVYCADSSALLVDDIFAGNSASQGAAIFGSAANIIVNNCTLTANSATSGGAIAIQGGFFAATNSIFWNNVDSTGLSEAAQINNQGGAVALSHSIVTALSAYAGNQNIAYDPLFQSPSIENFMPVSASPAINAGLNSAVSAHDADFNGNPRIVQTTVDIGAIEVQGPAGTPVTLGAEPSPQSTCPGGTASFTVVGQANSGSQFVWQVNKGSGFQSIPNDGSEFVFTNNNSQTVAISNAPANFSYSYRFLVPSAGYTSPSYPLTILPPRVIYLNASATGANTGASWANAFTSWAAALASGDACSQIWVAAGNYAPAPGQVVQLKSGLQIYGGFVGTETTLAQRNWAAHPTTLSASSTSSALFNQGYSLPIDRSAVLDGFFLNGSSSQPVIKNIQASPTIRNCVFQSNSMTALENFNSSPLIDTCIFTNNTDLPVTILGGAPIFTNCIFAGNSASGSGGAILSSSGAQTTVLRCLFQGNKATGSGGALENDGSIISVVNSVFAGNSAGGVGGAVANEGNASASFTNSVFYGGYAFGSAAIYNNGTLSLVNCTIARNATQSEGGAVSSFGGNAAFYNTILWENTTSLSPPSPELQQFYNGQGTPSVNHCVLQGLTVFAGNSNIATDPLFLDPDDNNYAVSSSSPAINAGLNSANNAAIDLAGQSRVQFGTIDIGAFESSTAPGSAIQFVVSPASQSVCGATPVAFAVQSMTPNSFVWQYFDGVGWDSFAFNSGNGTWNGPALGSYQITSNASTSTLTVSGVSQAMSGYKFRFTIPSAFTNSALVLTVLPSSIIYVNNQAALGGDGLGWGTAFRDLQSALNAVSGCRHEIWVVAGTYITTGSAAGYSIPPGATLYGGFAGSESARAQRNPQANPTVLQSQSPVLGSVVSLDGTTVPIGPETILDGFILQNGMGSALNIRNASPSIQNCVFRDNEQGAFLSGGGPSFQNCSFAANNAVIGGGIQASNTAVSCLNCSFSGNTAAENGGALYIYNSLLRLTNCLLVGNSAANGAGIDFDGSSSGAIVNCTIAGNTAFTQGGGLFGNLGSLAVANSIFWDNTENQVANLDAQVFTLPVANLVSSCVQHLPPSGNGNINNDPLFTDAAAGQYDLGPCSPAINAGASAIVSSVAVDLNGLPRRVGVSVDIGAIEFQGAGTAALSISTQPATIYFCPEGVNNFQVTASGSGLTYQWLANFGQGFVPLTDNAMFTGSTSAVLTINMAATSDNGRMFECVVMSSAGCSVVSDPAPLMVSPLARYYVNAASPGGDGSSWPKAFNNLSTAMNLSGNCRTEIWVARGTYTPPPQGWSLPDSVVFYGGFAGTETNVGQRSWSQNVTILDGQHTVFTLIHNSSFDSPAGPLSRLDGFTLQNAAGSAVSNFLANPTFANCAFRANGKAIYDIQSPTLISNCVFIQNGSPSLNDVGGGAIYYQNPAGLMLVENSIFQGNADGANGGAIGDDLGSMTFVNCLFSGNYTPGNGGAISAGGGALITVINCTVAGNQSGFFGAGLSTEFGHIVNSIFWNNYSQSGTATQHTNETAQISISDGGSSNVVNTCVDGLTVNGPFSGNGNIGADPDFIQGIAGSSAPVVGGNFHVSSCSPTLNAGTNNQASLGVDLDGNPRILGSSVDIGAYEGSAAVADIVSMPQNQSGGVSNVVQFRVASSVTNVTYQWQFQASTNSAFTNLTNNVQYSGVTTPVLTVTKLSPTLEGGRYRCEIVDQCTAIFSSAASFHFLYEPPVILGASATNFEGFAASGQLQAFDPQGLSLTYIVSRPPANGFVDLSGAPFFQFIASNRFFFGNDSFTYYVSDGFTNSAPATVNVTLIKVESNPTAFNLSVTVPENTPANFALGGSDVNGDPLTFLISQAPAHGALNLIGSNVFYTPALNYSGPDSFIYQSSNGVYDSGIATVSLSVVHENRPPTANPDSATIYNGQSVSIPVLNNDIDLDNNPLGIVGVTQGANGSVAFTSTNVVYSHNGSNTTNDFFTYTVSDGQGNRVTGTVAILITQPGTSFLVTNNADSGPGTLRAAIAGANTVAVAPYQILFSSSLAGQSIALSTIGDNSFGPSAFVLSNNVTIDAANAPDLRVLRQSGAPMRLFHVLPKARLALRNISLGNGYALGATGGTGINGAGAGGGAGGFGGAILSEGTVALNSVVLAGNQAAGGTGGVSAAGGSASVGNGGGVNGGVGASSPGGFGGGGAGSVNGPQTAGGTSGFGAGQGGGASPASPGGGAGGFGGGGGSGGGSSFSGGGGAGFGGAIFNRGGLLTATNCLFASNSVSGGAPGSGPALNYDGFAGKGLGGGIFNYNGSATLSGCFFVNNTADQCDGLYSIGDNTNVTTTIFQSTFTNTAGLTNFVQNTINAGSASGLSDNLSVFIQNQPFIRSVTNQTIVGPVALPFVISEPVGSPFAVSASSLNPSVIPNANVTLSGSGTIRTLGLNPIFGTSGLDNITIAVSDGPLSMAQIIPVNVTRNLTAFAPLGGAVTIPVFQPASGWVVTSVGQAASGSTAFNAASLTYSNYGAFTSSDAFTFQISNGSSTAAASVSIAILTNVPPIANPQFVSTFTNTPVAITLSGADAFNDPLTYVVATQPLHGLLSGTAPGLSYTPAANYSGPDSFTFHVNNRFIGSSNALVSIVVRQIIRSTVTTLSDSGAGSFRTILNQANVDKVNLWSISFAGSFANQILLLSTAGDNGFGSSALVVSNFLVVDGANLGISIATDHNAPPMRLFRLATNSQLTLLNLTLAGGRAVGGNGGSGSGGGGGGAGMGGAIFNEGILVVSNVVLSQNLASGGTGGKYATGGQADNLVPGGTGGGARGGTGTAQAPGNPGGFGGGGAGGGSTIAGYGSGGAPGYGAIAGGSYPVGPYTVFGGAGGFGGGGGGGWFTGGGGGSGMGGAIFNYGGAVAILNSTLSSNSVAGGRGYIFNNSLGLTGLGLGGAVFNYNGLLTISNSALTFNSASNGAGVCSVGDGSISQVTLRGNVMSNNISTDFVQGEINGGFASTSARADSIVQGSPWVQDLPDQTAPGAVTLPLTLSAPLLGFSNRYVTATSDNPSFLSPSNVVLTLSQVSGSLAIHPLLAPGVANITVEIADGNLSYNDTFQFSVNYNLSGVVAVGQSISLHPFPINSPLSITGVTQGTNGTVTFTAKTLTYNELNSSARVDSFTYTLSDGVHVVTANVAITIQQTTAQITSTADGGPGTLRDALSSANSAPGASWHFSLSPSLAGQTIILSTAGDESFGPSAMIVSGNVTIDGSSAPGAAISRDVHADPMRLFFVAPGGSLTLNNISLQGGFAIGAQGGQGESAGGGGAGFGGAVLNGGSFTASNIVFTFNAAEGGSGGDFVPTPSAGNGGGQAGGTGGLPSGKSGLNGGFAGGGGGGFITNQMGNGQLGGYGAGSGGGTNNGIDFGGLGGFGGGGGSGLGGGGGGGLGSGGALFNAGTAFLTKCSLLTNAALPGAPGQGFLSPAMDGTAGSAFGGALFNYNGELSLTNCVFSANMATNGGGLYVVSDGSSSSQVNLSGVTTSDPQGGTDFVPVVLNGGLLQIFTVSNSFSSQSPPFISALPNITTNSSFTVTLSASAPALGGAYSILATSGNPTLIANSNLVVSGAGHGATLTVTPTPGQSGSAWVTVTVTDSGISASTVFQVTVPGLAVSTPTILGQDFQKGTGFHIHFQGTADATYDVQSTTNLSSAWLDLGPAAQTTSGLYDFIDTNSLSLNRRFYRVK